ncbi:8280_t:CDS:2 [Ambispora leptoticha]|uniref:Saccharopine dehydrogenase [NAD(+), L-lysine-forming] n=1 Tax=Ambispora leptoticha TaxID=144679 RepID=A0A9N9AA26_9GLOM|nr:8280_t:CDS:2 [Ambispora leptoticha]
MASRRDKIKGTSRDIDAWFKITVERSTQRIFDDAEYEGNGCNMVPSGAWKTEAPTDAYIVGLKELPENDDSPLTHTHIFFAHCYKNQAGWQDILGRFARGKGVLLDLEYLTDEKGRRVAAFGYNAGFAGAAIGIDVWAQQNLNPSIEYPSIDPYPNENKLIEHVKSRVEAARKGGQYPRIMIIGALGRCGKGAVDFALKVGIPENHIIKWDIAETKKGGPFPEILEADIFINCIYLNQPIPPFITKDMLDGDRKLSVIVDVSCDTTNPHNPIPIYTINTTFDKPTVPVKTKNERPLEVISIDHLPTLLPRESSEAFCNDLLPSLLELPNLS